MKSEKSEVKSQNLEVRTRARVSCPIGADLDAWSRHEWSEGVQIDTLQDLETLLVQTLNSTYEIMGLCPRTGEVLVRGGQFFPEYTPARLAGSSLGGSFLKQHGVYVGFSMELQHEQQTILTTRVRSIELKSDDLVQ
jgi:hypothetical protein